MNPGLLGQVGRYCATHFRSVVIAWGVLFAGLGFLAPKAEDVLAGAGWKDSGSESVAARELIEPTFPGQGAYAVQVVLHGEGAAVPGADVDRVRGLVEADPDISALAPSESSPRGRFVVASGGAGGGESEMVRSAERIREQVEALEFEGSEVHVAGLPGYWADFNDFAKESMISAEIKSWPITLLILSIAFGSLVAAGLPLLLTIMGLASAIGALWIGAQFGDISIWAVNFALMFALAVGIDYSLFVVVRFRSSLAAGLDPVEAVIETMDTAGKAVVLSGLTVIAALMALILIPSPPFQTTAIGMALAVLFVMLAAVTLLPAVLARLGERVNSGKLPKLNSAIAHRSERFASWAAFVWRRPVATGAVAVVVLGGLMVPLLWMETEMPGLSGLDQDSGARIGYEQIAEGFGPLATEGIDVVSPVSGSGAVRDAMLSSGLAVSLPARSDGLALVRGTPMLNTMDRDELAGLRSALPDRALVGGPVAERMDLETMLEGRLPILYAAVIGIGFLILLVALRAPLVAAASVLLNLLATGAAFGAAVVVFQDGVGADLIGTQAQGHITAWGPIFFFTLIFALAMDYTVFLLASVKEHFELTGDAREATVEGMARSGRVINAAAIVMVCVFFTFALAPALQPKEMGAILGLAVLLDATLVRLLLLPAILGLMGDRAWYLPAWLDRILPRLHFSHN